MTDAEIEGRLAACSLGGERGAFAAGTAFGDWRLTAFIAKGGTAEVYCAEHVVLGTPAAVKVLSEPLTDSRKARFLREAKLLAELKSSAFPSFLGYGETNGRPYIAEELLEPGELPTGDRARAKYLLALCNGLKELHARGVVHRDLKPANILFRKTGEPVIVDFGLAKSVDMPIIPDGVSIVDGKTVGVGTPEYAAPEQFTGGDITPASDIHALGVLTKKLISSSSGRNSRGGDIPVAACWRHIIRRATSSIASERYQSVDAFATAIRHRHWLRNVMGICILGLSLAIIGFAVANLPQMLVDPFTAEFRHEGNEDGREVYSLELGGRWLHVGADQRVTLKGPALYKVKGPGGLYANVDGVADVEIEVGLASFYNETEIPVKDSSIKYRMSGNAVLIFSRLYNEDAPDKLIVGPGFNRLSFGLGKRK